MASWVTAVGDVVIRTYDSSDFSVDQLVAAKGNQRVTVCLPAKNEAATIVPIVTTIRDDLLKQDLVDEILVIDDQSSDDTGARAEAVGARVVRTGGILGAGTGKGEALWTSVAEATGDIIVWCDADIDRFGSGFVLGLLGPLLIQPDIVFVKGYYQRPATHGDTGGRVTELMARPVISLLYPQLASVVQPLSGEYAGRRDALASVPFVQGYGVDLGLLIDLTAKYGAQCIAQASLGERVHRNRPLHELSPQALEVLHVALDRAGVDVPDEALLYRPRQPPLERGFGERPPVDTLAVYSRANS
jgi:glucosyl-3-phosphoglycerate synthase